MPKFNNKGTRSVRVNFYKCAHFVLFWLLSTIWIYHFNCYSMSFLPIYLIFHLDSLHCHPDSPHSSHVHPDSFILALILCAHIPIPFLAFPPFSPHSPHSIPQFPSLTFTDSLLNFYSFSTYFRYLFILIVALVKKQTLPLFTAA